MQQTVQGQSHTWAVSSAASQTAGDRRLRSTHNGLLQAQPVQPNVSSQTQRAAPRTYDSSRRLLNYLACLLAAGSVADGSINGALNFTTCLAPLPSTTATLARPFAVSSTMISLG